TDPARSLGAAIGASLTGEPRPVAAAGGLHAMQLDPVQARTAFLARWRDTLIQILDRGTYLDADDIAGLVDAALPGADEAMALLALLDLEDRSDWARIIVDTAPTGHTLRLLELPDTFEQLLALLDAMQEKHRFMVRALTHRYRADDADRFLAEMTRRLSALRETLRSAERTGFVLVTRAEPMVSAETARYAAALERLGIAIRALVVNAVAAEVTADAACALAELDAIARGAPRFVVPLLDEPPLGLPAIERWAASWRASDVAAAARSPANGETGGRVTRVPAWARPRVAALTIVAGKGGVGKTSVACALAIDAASVLRRALLVSTDPAPSIADALDAPIGDAVTPVPGVEGLFAQQLDAAAAFGRFRDAYGRRVDALFDSVLGRGVDAAVDRRIARDLLSLAPPGVDELYALAALGETLDQDAYASIIVDPAPTGHLLRLLDMPALALDWSHRLLRLMLKYKEVAELGSAAEELLAFARRTRALQQLLHTSARCSVVIVTMDEPLVRAETARLVSEIRARDIGISALVWNRVTHPPRPLPGSPATEQFQAAEVYPPPRGAGPLREWLAGWNLLEAHERD
ncbi:MAG TPA: ArsA family ATPase, partial [Gemmatimonadaceae bacterium]|nr:ArsA family ATPase [Gemmatimonadaceae bacterium]